MSEVKKIDCPWCGSEVLFVIGDLGDPGRTGVPWHLAPRSSPGLLRGRCPAIALTLEEAEATARIRDLGGDRLRLAAHP